ncbi:MAG: hypothetical protein ACREIU_03120, partial [Planctomycetota bacterium]
MTEILAPPFRARGFGEWLLAPAVGTEGQSLQSWWARARAHLAEPWSRREESVRDRFEDLRDRWKRETAWTSSSSKKVLHPCYQRIIGLGPDVVPVLLREMETRPDHWGWALFAITGVQPVDPRDAGRLDRIAEAWVRWGR